MAESRLTENGLRLPSWRIRCALKLVDSVWPIEAPFEMIFQRNVVSYLEHSCRHFVLRHMTCRLALEGGLVFEEARL